MPGWIRYTRKISWLGLISSAVFLIYADTSRPRLPEGVRGYVDVIYRRVGFRNQKLDVYVPKQFTGDPRPAIVAIHGGSWKGGSKNTYGRDVSKLVNHGYVVISVSYCLASPSQPSWPDNLEDLQAAIRWIRRHAGEYGVDSSRIVAFGASAGGHLAALLGTHMAGTDEEAKVQAVVCMYGPTDLRDLCRKPRPEQSLRLLFGKSVDEAPEFYVAASPLTHVSRANAPMLFIHGEIDDSIPVEQSVRMAETLRSHGVATEMILVPGAGHSFRFDAAAYNLVPRIVAFLDRNLDRRNAQISSDVWRK